MPDFFSLPGEIRNQVYQYLGQDEGEIEPSRLGMGLPCNTNALRPRPPPFTQVSRQARQECSMFFTQPRALRCIDYPAFARWVSGHGQFTIHNLVKVLLKVELMVRTLNSPPSAKLCHLYIRYRHFHGGTNHGEKRILLQYDPAGAPGAIKGALGICNLIITPSMLRRMIKGLRGHLPLAQDFGVPELISLIESLRDGELLVYPVHSIAPSSGIFAEYASTKANSFLIQNHSGKCKLSSFYRDPEDCFVFYGKVWKESSSEM